MLLNSHQLLTDQFHAELNKIHKFHISRKARLAQSTLEYIEFSSITAPSVAAECKKLLIQANPYTGDYWRSKGESDNSLSLNSTLINN